MNLSILIYDLKKIFLYTSIFILLSVFIKLSINLMKNVFKLILNNINSYILINRIPGPPIFKYFPLLGNLDIILTRKGSDSQKFKEWLIYLCDNFGSEGILRFWYGPIYPILIVSKPEVAKVILNSTHSLDKADLYHRMEIFGNGLFSANGQNWKYQRKLLNPFFKLKELEKNLPVIRNNVQIFLDKVERLIDENNGICNDSESLISSFMLDSTAETLMNVKLNSQFFGEQEYLKVITEESKKGLELLMRPWMWYLPILEPRKFGHLLDEYTRKFKSFTYNMIIERTRLIDENLSSDGSEEQLKFLDNILSHHLHNKQSFSFHDVSSNVNTFMIAGHDTTTSSLSFTLYLIGHHKNVQKKLNEEIDLLYDNSENKDLSIDKLKQLKYMDCVIKESLRLYPPLHLIARKTTKEIIFGKYKIPKNAQIYIPLYYIHRNPIDFPEPDTFNPQRFLPENSADRHPYAFMPFSAGPRICIAKNYGLLTQKALLCRLLKDYWIESVGEMGDVIPFFGVIAEPENKILLKFIKRQ